MEERKIKTQNQLHPCQPQNDIPHLHFNHKVDCLVWNKEFVPQPRVLGVSLQQTPIYNDVPGPFPYPSVRVQQPKQAQKGLKQGGELLDNRVLFLA
nr:hypothetical protein Iba_chr11aCG7410 [Ipomoea batatas]GMD51908.1 hypothetical protein Iba_chr11bCG6820 [Ipomoea batatas]